MATYPCLICGKDARYELADKTWRCDKHVPDVGAPARPTACRVFSATRAYDRERLGERMTEWVRANNVEVTQMFVAQSSDNAFHCISLVAFYRERT